MTRLWKCNVCGYIHEGDQAPNECPKCGAPKEKFSVLSSHDTDKILKADRTNTLHMELAAACEKLMELCQEGIDLNLDPGCLVTFEKGKQELKVIKQRCKAEIATHVEKSKW